jgi:hypothetical protein
MSFIKKGWPKLLENPVFPFGKKFDSQKISEIRAKNA